MLVDIIPEIAAGVRKLSSKQGDLISIEYPCRGESCMYAKKVLDLPYEQRALVILDNGEENLKLDVSPGFLHPSLLARRRCTLGDALRSGLKGAKRIGFEGFSLKQLKRVIVYGERFGQPRKPYSEALRAIGLDI